MSLPRPHYRLRQFFSALRPRLQRPELTDARNLLGADLFPLFRSMTVRDQRHSLDVLRYLRRQGCQDRDMLAAALLHDIGKGGNIRMWERIAYVLLNAATPSLLGRVNRGLARLRDHAETGGRLAAAAGAGPELVRLIARHEDRKIPQSDRTLFLLRLADDAC